MSWAHTRKSQKVLKPNTNCSKHVENLKQRTVYRFKRHDHHHKKTFNLTKKDVFLFEIERFIFFKRYLRR